MFNTGGIMTVNKARKVLRESKFYWSNYFDLCGFMDQRRYCQNDRSCKEIEAIETMMRFLLHG